jgi:hypothetical protein
MNKPLSKAEIESAAEFPSVPRYVIVRTFSGYQFAPEILEPARSGDASKGPRPAMSAARNRAPEPLSYVVLVFLAGFFGVFATAAIIAGLLIKIAGFVH